MRFPALTVSAATGEGLQELGPFLFRALEVVRVYTKSPGKPADTDREIASDLKFARIWGRSVYDGQQTGPEHRVEDGDVVELHL